MVFFALSFMCVVVCSKIKTLVTIILSKTSLWLNIRYRHSALECVVCLGEVHTGQVVCRRARTSSTMSASTCGLVIDLAVQSLPESRRLPCACAIWSCAAHGETPVGGKP